MGGRRDGSASFSPPITWFSFSSIASVTEESPGEVVKTRLNVAEDDVDIGIGTEGLDSNTTLKINTISCAPITTAFTASTAYATPNLQAGLTPQISVCDRRLSTGIIPHLNNQSLQQRHTNSHHRDPDARADDGSAA